MRAAARRTAGPRRAIVRCLLWAGLCLEAIAAGTPDDAPGDAPPGDEPPLSFGFLDEVPGKRYAIGNLRLHLDCDPVRSAEATADANADADADTDADSGARDAPADPGPVVLFEAGLGGSALEWTPVRERLRPQVRTCTYDRAGYGWSDPSARVRDAERLAAELAELLDVAGLDAPVVVVAHSFGGFVARLLATRHPEAVAGLVLVDTSHEQQFSRFETAGGKLMVPRGRQFLISQNDVPEGLPPAVRRRVAALSRLRKTYAATHGEMASFRDSAIEVARARAQRSVPFEVPVTVIRRGVRLYPDDSRGRDKNDGWVELQEDLASLGTPGRLVVAEGAGHHVHIDAPALVADEVRALVDAARAGSSPGKPR